MIDHLNFLIAGVGGQGIILASNVLADVGLAAGFQAKQAEVHGMSQRGGSVTSFVRWGKVVYSPLIGAGEVDVLLSFEKLEALRCINQLRKEAIVLVNDREIEPLTVISGSQVYPSAELARAAFSKVSANRKLIDGETIAERLGSSKVVNVVLLGALSVMLEQEQLLEPEMAELWLKAITGRVPAKQVELNKQAFEAGRKAV